MPRRPPNALPIADYALIGDCHSAALVSRAGSIDWCCLPRFDSDSCFGRLLDRRAGHFSITLGGPHRTQRRYLDESLVLATRHDGAAGSVEVIDFFAMRQGGREHPRRRLVRIVQALGGRPRVQVRFSPRLDYGEVAPWIHRIGDTAFAAVGSNTALVIGGDIALERDGEHDLSADVELQPGDRLHLAMQFLPPEQIDDAPARAPASGPIEDHLRETLAWWRGWSAKLRVRRGVPGASALRSAITLKALTFAPTGAIVAAPTTSLPEGAGGVRNWDYRYSWVRDSVFTVRALASVGCTAEADGFRRFVQRSAAGSADDVRVMFAVDGKRRLPELALGHLEGWRGSRPVRIGNAACGQFQADVWGLLLELAWHWSERGNRPGADDWAFLAEAADCAARDWREPDHGIWEIRDAPRHFVHSKVSCWVAVDRALRLAERLALPAPRQRWRAAREAIRRAVLADGVARGGTHFVAAFGSQAVDAALLLLPELGFVEHRAPLMLGTVDAIMRELDAGGLILRYRTPDGLAGSEGSFVACTFWLAQCLARQGRLSDARRYFANACRGANDLGLFAEQFDAGSGELLGNFPQGLSHLAHLSAALEIESAGAGPVRMT